MTWEKEGKCTMTIYDHWLYRFLTGPLNNVAWLYILLP